MGVRRRTGGEKSLFLEPEDQLREEKRVRDGEKAGKTKRGYDKEKKRKKNGMGMMKRWLSSCLVLPIQERSQTLALTSPLGLL